MTNSKYRPCTVHGKKAIFHKWEEMCNVVGAEIHIGGAPAGQIKYTNGIIEYENGMVERVFPNEIKFCDKKCEAVWHEQLEGGKG